MPYIAQDKRALLEHSLASLCARVIVEERSSQAGVLNYCISALLNEVLNTNGVNYRNINELIGVEGIFDFKCHKQHPRLFLGQEN